MDSSNKKSVVILAVLIIVVFALIVFFGGLSSTSVSEKTSNVKTTQSNTVVSAPVIKLAPAEIQQKKAEILQRINDTAHPLTVAEKESFIKYVSGSTGDQFGFTMEEKLAIVKALNRK